MEVLEKQMPYQYVALALCAPVTPEAVLRNEFVEVQATNMNAQRLWARADQLAILSARLPMESTMLDGNWGYSEYGSCYSLSLNIDTSRRLLKSTHSVSCKLDARDVIHCATSLGGYSETGGTYHLTEDTLTVSLDRFFSNDSGDRFPEGKPFVEGDGRPHRGFVLHRCGRDILCAQDGEALRKSPTGDPD